MSLMTDRIDGFSGSSILTVPVQSQYSREKSSALFAAFEMVLSAPFSGCVVAGSRLQPQAPGA